jgi:hypothetical protein
MQSDDSTARLLDALKGIDLSRADGRIGIGSLLAEIERRSPGAILRHAATIQLRSLGCDTRLADGAS